jgi:hypothetical protein
LLAQNACQRAEVSKARRDELLGKRDAALESGDKEMADFYHGEWRIEADLGLKQSSLCDNTEACFAREVMACASGG